MNDKSLGLESLGPVVAHADGIYTVDAQYMRPRFASAHLLQRKAEVAIVDCGTNSSVSAILSALEHVGLAPEQVTLLFLTHVHLDHSGGAGLLLQKLPNARVVAHPRAVPHLADPSKLAAASAAVYGQKLFDELYGDLVPIASERIQSTQDGTTLTLGGDELQVMHTPGHALHHHALYDARTRSVFSGDTFGVSYRATDHDGRAFIIPTTTPTQFDPEQLTASIERIQQLSPTAVYLTHYGRVSDVQHLGEALKQQIQQYVEIAQRCEADAEPEAAVRRALAQLTLQRLQAHLPGATEQTVEDVLGGDLTLNAQGLWAWRRRLSRAARGSS